MQSIGSALVVIPVAADAPAALAHGTHACRAGAGIGLFVILIVRAGRGIGDQLVALISLLIEHPAILIRLAQLAILLLAGLGRLAIGAPLLLELLLPGLLALLLRRLSIRIMIQVTAANILVSHCNFYIFPVRPIALPTCSKCSRVRAAVKYSA